MSPVFNPKRQAASYEVAFEVSAAPDLVTRARVRNPERPDFSVVLTPDEVTVRYVLCGHRWVPSGIEVRGASPGRVSPLVMLFTPDTQLDELRWDADVPGWALDLVRLMAPTQTPG